MQKGQSAWYYAIDGRRFGPVPGDELRRLAQKGDLRSSDLVWRAGMQDWAPASSLRGLFADSPPPVPRYADPVRPTDSSDGTEAVICISGPSEPLGLVVWAVICWVPLLVLTALVSRVADLAGLTAVITVLIVLCSAFWAGTDSRRLGFREYRSVFASGPWAVGLSVALFWAAVFPWYLADRGQLVAGRLPRRAGDAVAAGLSAKNVLGIVAAMAVYYGLNVIVAAVSTAK